MEAKPLQLLIPDQVKHLLRETPKVLLELLLRYLTLSYLTNDVVTREYLKELLKRP